MRCRITVPLLVVVLLSATACKNKEVNVGKNNSAIELLDSIHDFGTWRGDTLIQRCSFRLRNTGTEPLVIHDVRTGCGCTTSEFDHEPILPGKITTIKVSYNGRGKITGTFVNTLDVYSNAKSGMARLTIKGNMEK